MELQLISSSNFMQPFENVPISTHPDTYRVQDLYFDLTNSKGDNLTPSFDSTLEIQLWGYLLRASGVSRPALKLSMEYNEMPLVNLKFHSGHARVLIINKAQTNSLIANFKTVSPILVLFAPWDGVEAVENINVSVLPIEIDSKTPLHDILTLLSPALLKENIISKTCRRMEWINHFAVYEYPGTGNVTLKLDISLSLEGNGVENGDVLLISSFTNGYGDVIKGNTMITY